MRTPPAYTTPPPRTTPPATTTPPPRTTPPATTTPPRTTPPATTTPPPRTTPPATTTPPPRTTPPATIPRRTSPTLSLLTGSAWVMIYPRWTSARIAPPRKLRSASRTRVRSSTMAASSAGARAADTCSALVVLVPIFPSAGMRTTRSLPCYSARVAGLWISRPRRLLCAWCSKMAT